MKQLLSTLALLLGLTFLGTNGALAYSQTPWATTGDAPYALVQDSLGNIYTVNQNSFDVTKITPAGVSTLFTAVGNYPTDIAIESADTLYVTNTDESTVTKITPAVGATVIGSTGLLPMGIVLDTLGNVYRANRGDDTVTKVTPAGVVRALPARAPSPTILI